MNMESNFDDTMFEVDEFDETPTPEKQEPDPKPEKEGNQETTPPSEGDQEDDLTTEVLKLRGISNPDKIKFEDESGAITERSWDSLTKEEQINILADQREDQGTNNDLAEDEIEYGVGIHGEPGYRREKLQSSKVLAKELVSKILADYQEKPKEVGVLVNGMGGTPLMELFVFMNDVQQLLEQAAVKVTFHKVGNFMTSLDMQGLSLTMIDLTDTNWQEALESEVQTISWQVGVKK